MSVVKAQARGGGDSKANGGGRPSRVGAASMRRGKIVRGWGGRRPGAGRKPKGKRAGVRHALRPSTDRERVVFVTMRVRDTVPNLRCKKSYKAILAAFSHWREREGFRLLHFSVMGNHVHLIAEARNKRVLSKAMQGIAIRIAKRLNKVGRASGRVFSGRYHSDVLDTPVSVRNVLAYVLCNARKHGIAKKVKRTWVDPWSSGSAFTGWRGKITCDAQDPPPIADPQSDIGRNWHKRGGGIPPDTVPGQRSHLRQ